MTQLERLKIRITENTTDEELGDILDSAKNIILARRYPFSDFPVDENGETVLEARYLDLQIRIAVELFNKIGAEGQTSHSENGVSRSYESANVSESLLREVVPKAAII